MEPSFLPGKSNFAFRGQYKILKEDPSELATLNEDATQFFKREKITMSASMRPVYVRPAGTGNANISNGEIDDTTAVLFHDGARWNMLQIVDVDPSLGKAPTESQIRKAFRVHKQIRQTHAYIHAHMYMHAYMCIDACKHSMYIDTYVHSCINAYMHILIHIWLPSAEL